MLLWRVLEEAVALGREAQEAAPVEALARFEAVIIEDSSTVSLPDTLADVWECCGGGTGAKQGGSQTARALGSQRWRGPGSEEHATSSRRSKQSRTPTGQSSRGPQQSR